MLDSYYIIEGNPYEDITDNLEALMDRAHQDGKALWIGHKNAVISRPIELKAPIHGVGIDLCGFKSRITDGTPTLYKTSGEYYELKNFALHGDNAYQNSVGIKLGEFRSAESSLAVRRSIMTNIRILHFAVGLEWQGWINNIYAVLIRNCVVGAKLSRQNASNIGISFEANKQDFQMWRSKGSFWPMLMMEGNKEIHEEASTLDNVNALTIGALYTEHYWGVPGPETAPWLHIGVTEKCRGITINSASLDPSEVESILVDDAVGVTINVYKKDPATIGYRVTEKAVNVYIKDFSQ